MSLEKLPKAINSRFLHTELTGWEEDPVATATPSTPPKKDIVPYSFFPVRKNRWWILMDTTDGGQIAMPIVDPSGQNPSKLNTLIFPEEILAK